MQHWAFLLGHLETKDNLNIGDSSSKESEGSPISTSSLFSMWNSHELISYLVLKIIEYVTQDVLESTVTDKCVIVLCTETTTTNIIYVKMSVVQTLSVKINFNNFHNKIKGDIIPTLELDPYDGGLRSPCQNEKYFIFRNTAFFLST